MGKKKKIVKIEKFEQELKDKKNQIQIEKKEVVKKCIELFCPKSRYGSKIDEEKFMDLMEKTISEYISLPTDHIFTIPELEKKWNKKSKRVEPTEEGVKGRKVNTSKDSFVNNLAKKDYDLIKEIFISNTIFKDCSFNMRSLRYYNIREERKNRSFFEKMKYLSSDQKKKDDNFIKNYKKDMEKIKEISKNIKK